MTDRVDSQEAGDVALAVRTIIAPLKSPMTKDEIAAVLVPGVARLVREGQIRCLEAAAKEVCAYCDMGVPRLSERDRCPAEPLHARIAALKQQEG